MPPLLNIADSIFKPHKRYSFRTRSAHLNREMAINKLSRLILIKSKDYRDSSAILVFLYIIVCIFRKKSEELCDIVYESLGFLPTKARVGDRLSVHLVRGYLLASILDIAFYHKALNERFNIGRETPAVKHLFAYSYLLEILLSGV